MCFDLLLQRLYCNVKNIKITFRPKEFPFISSLIDARKGPHNNCISPTVYVQITDAKINFNYIAPILSH